MDAQRSQVPRRVEPAGHEQYGDRGLGGHGRRHERRTRQEPGEEPGEQEYEARPGGAARARSPMHATSPTAAAILSTAYATCSSVSVTGGVISRTSPRSPAGSAMSPDTRSGGRGHTVRLHQGDAQQQPEPAHLRHTAQRRHALGEPGAEPPAHLLDPCRQPAPLQVVDPTVTSRFDDDATIALQTRLDVLDWSLTTGGVLIGTHFPSPAAGVIASTADGLRFEPL